MMKYTRKQICEAIKHWQKQLKKMNEDQNNSVHNLWQYVIQSNKDHGAIIDGRFYASQTFSSKNDLIDDMIEKYDFVGWENVSTEEIVASNEELFDRLTDIGVVQVKDNETDEGISIHITPDNDLRMMASQASDAAKMAARAAARAAKAQAVTYSDDEIERRMNAKRNAARVSKAAARAARAADLAARTNTDGRTMSRDEYRRMMSSN